ncbi:MAG: glutathione S-transferase family protein [Pseudomonadota bacterium]
MYELVIANKNYSSWSMRPWVLMRALRIPFAERLLPFHANNGPGDFRNFSPSGRVPCLLDGPLKVWDSLSIAEYLAERHAGVWPVDPGARAWARSAAAEMHSGFQTLRNVCSMSVGLRVRLHEISETLQAELSRLAELWTWGLAAHGGGWLAGDNFTAVDAFFAPVATRVQTYGLPLPAKAAEYAQRLLDFEPVKEWVAAGIAEPWRDAAHEAEVLAHGEITRDLRAKPA